MEENPLAAGTSRGGGHDVLPLVKAFGAGIGEPGFDLRKPEGGIGGERVEIFHERRLGQDGQGRKRGIFQTFVEAAVEGRIGMREAPELGEAGGLEILQSGSWPPVADSQSMPPAQEL